MRTSASSSDGIAMPRTPKEQVFGLIIDDFKSALVLPETQMMAMPQVWQPRLIWAKCIIKWLAWTLINKRI